MRTGRTTGLWSLWALSLVVVACAKGGAPVADDVDPTTDAPHAPTVDAHPTIDAHVNVTIDASPIPDAHPIPDAAPVPDALPPADAAPQLCTVNNDCTIVGQCCYFFQCVPGTGVGENVCFRS